MDKPQQEIFKVEVPKVEMPTIIGKIDIYSIDSSTRPIKKTNRWKLPQRRDDVISGWDISNTMMKRNYKKNKNNG